MISPVTLADLNHFLIVQIERRGERTLITGRMSEPGQPSVDEHVNLFITRFSGTDRRRGEVTVGCLECDVDRHPAEPTEASSP